MFILGRAHQSHPAKHVLGWAVGGGWPLSQAQHWVANKASAQPGSPSAGRQTPEGGRPWPGLTRPGPVRLARPAAATLTNTPLIDETEAPGPPGPSSFFSFLSFFLFFAFLVKLDYWLLLTLLLKMKQSHLEWHGWKLFYLISPSGDLSVLQVLAF
jgi:hypothetical protein